MGESRHDLHVFAWIFAICEFCDFPLIGRFRFWFCPHLGLLEIWRILNKQTETAGTTAACCFKGTPSSSLLVAVDTFYSRSQLPWILVS